MLCYAMLCFSWALAVVAPCRAPRPGKAARTLVRLLTLAALAPILFPCYLAGKLKAGAPNGRQPSHPAGADGRAEASGV